MTQITTEQKRRISEAVIREKLSLGSFAAVAKKCELNPSYISQMVTGNVTSLTDLHWLLAAQKLDVSLLDWNSVETTNSSVIRSVLGQAKHSAMFIAISNPAGSGKTATCRAYRDANAQKAVFYYCVEHASMGKNDFLHRLGRSLGLDLGKGTYFLNANNVADLIIDFFMERLAKKPLLIVDEADKLNDKALAFFISLYNRVEGRMGCVILGTENLEKKVKMGVSWQKNGYDEIDSRFGRRFVKLDGFPLNECRKICEANGITDRAKQKEIFDECQPVSTVIGQQEIKVVRDLRPLRRKIEREKLLMQNSQEAQNLPQEEAAS